MTKLHSTTLEGLREAGRARLQPQGLRVTVGLGTCGLAAGAKSVLDALDRIFSELGVKVVLEPVGCRGLCYAEPLVEVYQPDGSHHLFGGVDADDAREIACALASGSIGSISSSLAERVVASDYAEGQERRVLSHCGYVNPASLEEYVAAGGYSSFEQVLRFYRPEEVIDLMIDSDLRGRGGAGYPTGLKWRATRDGSSTGAESDASEDSAVRYFIVNGDEGDPGAYMDRGLLEGDPYRVLEGLEIACYATEAHQAYIFIRAEYPLAVQSVNHAIAQATAAGLLGKNILGSGFDLDVSVVRGAGAFLCGESTAMINVLEGKECTVRHTPPYPTEKGLWGCPTCVNNVETLANVPLIVERGADWFKSVGTDQSAGTKVFSLAGTVRRVGLVEVPFGTSMGTIVNDIGQALNPKAVQIGGPSGAILSALDTELEMSFEGLADAGGMVGSGGFVVIDDSQCVVDTASYLVHFAAKQSCRRCRLCREGLDECAAIFDRITTGEAQADDLDRLRAVSERNCASELCGLGRTALAPVLTSLRYFADEYEAHVQKCCPALVCTALISYVIATDTCQGERCCLLTCPGNAVKGRFGKPGHIVGRLCQKCGMCIVSCPYGAVKKVSPVV